MDPYGYGDYADAQDASNANEKNGDKDLDVYAAALDPYGTGVQLSSRQQEAWYAGRDASCCNWMWKGDVRSQVMQATLPCGHGLVRRQLEGHALWHVLQPAIRSRCSHEQFLQFPMKPNSAFKVRIAKRGVCSTIRVGLAPAPEEMPPRGACGSKSDLLGGIPGSVGYNCVTGELWADDKRTAYGPALQDSDVLTCGLGPRGDVVFGLNGNFLPDASDACSFRYFGRSDDAEGPMKFEIGEVAQYVCQDDALSVRVIGYGEKENTYAIKSIRSSSQFRNIAADDLHKVQVYPTLRVHSWGTVVEVDTETSILELSELIQKVNAQVLKFREHEGEKIAEMRALPEWEGEGENKLEVWAMVSHASSQLYIHFEGLEEDTVLLVSPKKTFGSSTSILCVFRVTGICAEKVSLGIGTGKTPQVKKGDIEWLQELHLSWPALKTPEPEEVDSRQPPELKFVFLASGSHLWRANDAMIFWRDVHRVHGQDVLFETDWLNLTSPPGLDMEGFLTALADLLASDRELPLVYGYLCLLTRDLDAITKVANAICKSGLAGRGPSAAFLKTALWNVSRETWEQAEASQSMEELVGAQAKLELQGWMISLILERMANSSGESIAMTYASKALKVAFLFDLLRTIVSRVHVMSSQVRLAFLGDVWQLVMDSEFDDEALELLKRDSQLNSLLAQVAWRQRQTSLPQNIAFDDSEVLELLGKFAALPSTHDSQQTFVAKKLGRWVNQDRPGGAAAAFRTLTRVPHVLTSSLFVKSSFGGQPAPLDLDEMDAPDLQEFLNYWSENQLDNEDKVIKAGLQRLVSLPPSAELSKQVADVTRSDFKEALEAMFFNHFRALVPSVLVADVKLMPWNLASKDHKYTYEGRIVQSELNDRVEKSAYYWIADEWWSLWREYAQRGPSTYMTPVRKGHFRSHLDQCISSDVFWNIFFEHFGTADGIMCSRRASPSSNDEVLDLDNDKLTALHALGKTELAELRELCAIPELKQHVPRKLSDILPTATTWILQRLATREVTGAEIQYLREQHLFRSRGVAEKFVDAVCPDSPGLLADVWAQWNKLVDFLKTAHSVAGKYPHGADVTPPAQKAVQRWQALLFACKMSTWSDWEKDLPARDVVERLQGLLTGSTFPEFCYHSDAVKQYAKSGLEWARAPDILAEWDRVRQGTYETAAQVQSLFDLLNLHKLWADKDNASLTSEMQEHLGEDTTKTVLFTISLHRSREFVVDILFALKTFDEVYPKLNVAKGELVDDLNLFLQISYDNPTPEIRGKVARLEDRHLRKWSVTRCNYAKAIAKGLEKIYKAHQALTSQHFDELQRVVNGLPGMVQEQQVFQTLADMMTSLAPLAEPAKHFTEGTKAVLDWLAVPDDDEMSRLTVSIESLDEYLEVFHTVAKEWSTDEYEKNLEQAQAALSAMQVELRLANLSGAQLQAIRPDAVEQYMYFHTESKTSYCFPDWTKFDQLKLVECRMLLYGQSEEQEEEQNKELMNDFRKLVSNLERFAALRLMMMQQGFLDMQVCISVYEKSSSSKTSEALDSLVESTTALQTLLDSETEHISKQGGTFLPTAMLARVLRELQRHPPGETGQVPKTLQGLGTVFNLETLKVPTEGTIAQQIVELDREMRNVMITQNIARGMVLDFELPVECSEGACSVVYHHAMIPPLFLVTALFAKKQRRLPRYYELLLYCPNSQVPKEELVTFISRLQSPKENEFFLVSGWDHAPKEHQAMLRENLPAFTTVAFLCLDGAEVQPPSVDCEIQKTLADRNSAQAFMDKVGTILQKLHSKLLCASSYASKFPGAGKSHRIQKELRHLKELAQEQADEQNDAARLSLFHNYTTAGLQESLQAQYDTSKSAIWLNLSQQCPRQAELDLYRLLVCGLLTEPNAFPLALNAAVPILIEIPAKCEFSFLRKGIECVEIKAPSQEDGFEWSDESVQAVCKSLRMILRSGATWRGGVSFEVSQWNMVEQYECIDLLRNHGPKYLGKPAVDTSAAVLIQFCRYLHAQLKRLHDTDIQMPLYEKEAKTYPMLVSETMKKLIRNAAQMYEVAVDSDTFELSRGWGSPSIEPLLFLERGSQPYVTVFASPHQPDPSNFDWGRIGACVNLVDGKAAWSTLDRVMSIPKVEIKLEQFTRISVGDVVGARALARSMNDDGQILEDVQMENSTIEAGCIVHMTSVEKLREAADLGITADATGTFPLMVLITLNHIRKVLDNVDDDFIVKQDFVVNGTRVLQGHVLRREAYFPNNPSKYPVMLEALTEIETRGLEFPLQLTVLEPEGALAERGYVLTMDNVLKMILVRFRLDHGPVLIMGETGCGKTSLVKYLCGVSGISLHVLDVHGGIEVQNVRDFMQPVLQEANGYLSSGVSEPRQVWVFLDELNTSGCLDFFAEMICDHRFDGERLPDNLRVLGASNPYRKAVKGTGAGTSLKTRSLNRSDSTLNRTLSSEGLHRTLSTSGGKPKQDDLTLVYQVLPLPESLRDFVWDFGALAEDQRNKYIREMVKTHFRDPDSMGAFAQLIVKSMKVLLRTEDVSCVSLRDARRAVTLACFFHQDCRIEAAHASVLAAAVCFYYRLGTDEERLEFLKNATGQVDRHGKPLIGPFESAKALIESYQEAFTNIVDIPRGVARNESLTSNLFVMFTAISVKPPLPVFVVGKPGQSKTLAVSLLGSGRAAQPQYDVPLLSVLSYQCSEHTTAEGLDMHFEQAEALQEKRQGSRTPVRIVVFLDEVGLAEKNTRDRPLKVLHKRLEHPNVGFVGLSNTTLDASKMNRAIYLTHLDPGVEDLIMTATAILQGQAQNLDAKVAEQLASTISELFMDYLHRVQQIEEGRYFHLADFRGFYGLVKGMARYVKQNHVPLSMLYTSTEVCDLFVRNLGGAPQHKLDELLLDPMSDLEMGDAVRQWRQMTTYKESAKRMMAGCLADLDAQHLMVIAPDELYALRFLLYGENPVLSRSDTKVFFGSSFPEEKQSTLYVLELLSKIRLAMEVGQKVVLVNLGRLHESLYEVLNQQYTYFNGKPTCRVALGAESRQVPVHKDFRCVVVLTSGEVHPPAKKLDEQESIQRRFLSALLSRFEKVVVSYEVEIPDQLRTTCDNIKNIWISRLRPMNQMRGAFTYHTYIPGAAEDLVGLLMVKQLHATNNEHNVLEATAASSAVKQQIKDMLPPMTVLKAQFLKADIAPYMNSLWRKSLFEATMEKGSRLVVRTFDRVNSLLERQAQEKGVSLQMLNLGEFTSRASFKAALDRATSSSVLIIECLEADTPPAMLHDCYEIMQGLGAGKTESMLDSWQHVLFILQQKPFAIGPRVTVDFGPEWRHIWVDELVHDPSNNIPLQLEDLGQTPAQLCRGPRAQPLLLAALQSFVVDAYVSYPKETGSKKEAVQEMLTHQAFVKVAQERVFSLLCQSSVFQSWDKLLDKEYPQGIQQPLAQAAWRTLESRIHSGFADFWAALDAENNVNSFLLQDDPVVRDTWISFARNVKLCPFSLSQTAVQRPCVTVGKGCLFPFTSHVQRWLGHVRPELVAFLAAQPDSKINGRFASAYAWIRTQAIRLFSEAPAPTAAVENVNDVRGQLVYNLAVAVAPEGLHELLLPVAIVTLAGISKEGWEFISSIIAAVLATEHVFLNDSASVGCWMVLKQILDSTGEWSAVCSGHYLPADLIDVIFKHGLQGLQSFATQGKTIRHIDLAHVETALRTFKSFENKNFESMELSKLAYVYPMASILTRAKACADLALRIGDEHRNALAEFAMILFDSSARNLGEAMLENLERIPGFAAAYWQCKSSIMNLVARAFLDVKAGVALALRSNPGKRSAFMDLVTQNMFPPTVAMEILGDALGNDVEGIPAGALQVVEEAEKRLSGIPVSNWRGCPLVQALFLLLETSSQLQALAQGKPGMERLLAIYVFKLRVGRLKEQIAMCVDLNQQEKEAADRNRIFNLFSGSNARQYAGAKQSVEDFLLAASRLDEVDTLKKLVIDRLDDEFGAAVVREKLFIPSDDSEGQAHLLVPSLLTWKEVGDEAQDFLKQVPVLDHNTAYMSLKELLVTQPDDWDKPMRKILAESEYPTLVLCSAAMAVKQKYGSLPKSLPQLVNLDASLRYQDYAAYAGGGEGETAEKGFRGLNAEELNLLNSIINSTATSFLGANCRATIELGANNIIAEDVERLIVMCLATALEISRDKPSHPIQMFLRQPSEFSQLYLWGISTIKFYDQVTEIQASEYSRQLQRDEYLPIYCCPNEHPYWLGNCSRPWVVYKCQFCDENIGGQRHHLVAGNRNVPRHEWGGPHAGYCYSRMATSTDELQPKAFHALQFWTHALLIGALSVYPEAKDSALQFLPKHFPLSRKPLVEDVLSICMESLTGLMHAPGAAEKRRAEHVLDLALLFGDVRGLNSVWRNLVQESFQVGRTALQVDSDFNSLVDRARQPVKLYESKVDEAPKETKEFQATKVLLSLPPNGDVRNADYYKYKATLEQRKDEIPTCTLLLNGMSKLIYVTYLPDLLAILRVLYASYNGGRLSKAEAQNMSLEEALGPYRCVEMWEKFRKAWNAMRHNLERIECANVTLMEMGEEPPPTLSWFVCLDRGEGMQLWSLIAQVAGYQNNFIRDLPSYHQKQIMSEPVDVLQFDQRFAVGGGDVTGDESEFAWMEATLPCSMYLSSGHIVYEVEPFEAAAKIAVAPLRYIDLKKPVFQFADVHTDWQDKLEEKIKQAPLPISIRIELERRVETESIDQDAIAALRLLVTKCVYQLLCGVRADASVRLCDFAAQERLAQYGATFPGELAEVRLKHLAGFWTLLIEFYEPDFTELTDISYRDEWDEEKPEDDQAIYELWMDLQEWSVTDLRKLAVGFKIMLSDKLCEANIAHTSPMTYTLAATAFPEEYDLPLPFPRDLPLRYALSAFKYVRMVLSRDDEVPEAVKRVEALRELADVEAHNAVADRENAEWWSKYGLRSARDGMMWFVRGKWLRPSAPPAPAVTQDEVATDADQDYWAQRGYY